MCRCDLTVGSSLITKESSELETTVPGAMTLSYIIVPVRITSRGSIEFFFGTAYSSNSTLKKSTSVKKKKNGFCQFIETGH